MEELDDGQKQVLSTINMRLLDENLLLQLVDCIPISAMILNSEGFIIHANNELTRKMGYQPGELKNTLADNLLCPEFRDDHDVLMSLYFMNNNEDNVDGQKNIYGLRKDGSKVPVEVGLTPINGSGRSWMLMTVVDITPQVTANLMFQQSINAAPHGVLVINDKGEIELTNKLLCDLCGYNRDEILGKKIEFLIPERYRSEHVHSRHSFNTAPQKRVMGQGRDITALHKDGSELPIAIDLCPIDFGGRGKRVLVTLVDMTERNRMELELRESNMNLNEFNYVASHDLRSPLRGISDLVEWIKEDLGSNIEEPVSRNLDRVAIRINRMEELIDNLLTYARAGRVNADPEIADISQMFEGVLDILQPSPNFILDIQIELEQLLCVLTPLTTVLRNIISNAIKHHDKESGKIVIKCVAENSMCHFSICDDGPGIPASSKDRIFRLFQTVSAAERQGSGIGLSVSRRLVETHGGRISFEANTHQRGATFHIWWPRFIRKDTYV